MIPLTITLIAGVFLILIIIGILAENKKEKEENNKYKTFFNLFMVIFSTPRHETEEETLERGNKMLWYIRKELLKPKQPTPTDIRDKLIEYHSQVILDGKVDGKEKWIEDGGDKFLEDENK